LVKGVWGPAGKGHKLYAKTVARRAGKRPGKRLVGLAVSRWRRRPREPRAIGRRSLRRPRCRFNVSMLMKEFLTERRAKEDEKLAQTKDKPRTGDGGKGEERRKAKKVWLVWTAGQGKFCLGEMHPIKLLPARAGFAKTPKDLRFKHRENEGRHRMDEGGSIGAGRVS